jgi:hypothetical protein
MDFWSFLFCLLLNKNNLIVVEKGFQYFNLDE